MKFLIALLVVFYGTLSSSANVDRAIQNVAIAPLITSSVGFVSGEWLANLKCDFISEPDCSLSIHVNGRRIDSENHGANEQIFFSCIEASVAIDYAIHSFSYDDIQDYSCLHDTTRDLNSVWLNPSPIIETSGQFVHGQPASLTCNAPYGSSLYWVLPGLASDHQTAVVTDTSNAVNGSSTITFTIQDSDHFATYNCCIAIKNNQAVYSSHCTSYTISDSDKIGNIVTTSDYNTLRFQLDAVVESYPLPDPATVIWQQCVEEGQCGDISPAAYSADLFPERYCLDSHLQVLEDSTYTLYTFKVNNSDDSAQYSAEFVINFNHYFPLVSQQPTQFLYNPGDGTTSIILSFIIESNPAATLSFFKQNINSQSLGREPIATDGHITIDAQQTSDTQWTVNLLINQYDNAEDDAIYIIHAENDYGVTEYKSDTIYGPGNLVLTQNATADYSFNCEFDWFPYPSKYEINIVSPYPSSYTVVSETHDPVYEKTSIDVDVSLDAQNTFFQISCSAYDPYDENGVQHQSLTINVA